MRKLLSCFLLGLSFFSMGVQAVEEIIITGTPFQFPIPNFSTTLSSDNSSLFRGPGGGGGYKDVAIAQAKQLCSVEVKKIKLKECNDLRDSYRASYIQYCVEMGDSGTDKMVYGGAAAGGSAFALGAAAVLTTPPGWVVGLLGLTFVGGTAVAGSGAIEQQTGNYSCRDQAQSNFDYNTQVCINYANKFTADFCSKIQ